MTAAALEGDAYVRILLTRGVGEIVYDPKACPSPTVVDHRQAARRSARRRAWPTVSPALASVVRNHPGSVDPAIKSNNLLNNALAMQQAYREGAFEALMKNHRGELCECAQSNIFFVRDGVLLDAAGRCGAAGGRDAGVRAGTGAQRRVDARKSACCSRTT